MQEFINSFCSLNEPQDLYEVRIQSAWNDINSKQSFLSVDNQEITIHSPGTWNTEAGPDFQNAKISINDKIITGDIEIHYNSSDWLKHGHSESPLYDNVILHVVYHHDSKNKELDRFPSIVISSLIKETSNNDVIEKIHNGLCSDIFSSMKDDELLNFFKAAGLQRFQDKSEMLIKEMLSDDGNHILLKNLFESMGYKKNKDNFIELYNRLSKYPAKTRAKYYKNILWGESGVMPDPAVAIDVSDEMLIFIKNIWSKWWDIRIEPKQNIVWNRSGLRPLNSPERRIAAITGLIDLITLKPLSFFKKLLLENPTKNDFWNILKTELTIKDSLWGLHSNFKDKREKSASVLGEKRLLDLTINVILPAIYANCKIKKEHKTAQIAEKVWLNLPKSQNNKIIKTAISRWLNKERADFKIKNASAQQGIIHLYRNTCEKYYTDCAVCLYRKK